MRSLLVLRNALCVVIAALLLTGPAAATVSVQVSVQAGVSQDGAQWDGAQWDGAQWDGAQWDGAQWDGAQWDGAQWDGAQWDGAQWDSAYPNDGGLSSYQWGHAAADVTGAWSHSGHGDGSIVVCVLDSGVDYTHPDLQGRMWVHPTTKTHGYDFIDGDADPMDVGGHGTHVASIVGARAGDNYGIAGVANVQIMAVRVLGPNGAGTDTDFAVGIQWCADHGADILSMSLSTDEVVKVVESAMNYAVLKGALVVGSAGNHACQSCQGPLVKLKGLLTVAAVGPNGEVADFTTWGPNVDLGAPGVSIAGAIPNERWALGSGSSQAVPYVSGAAALAWMRNPSLTAGQLEDLLVGSAATLRTTADGEIPVVDARAAVALAGQVKYEAAELDMKNPKGPQLAVDAPPRAVSEHEEAVSTAIMHAAGVRALDKDGFEAIFSLGPPQTDAKPSPKEAPRLLLG